MGQHLGLWAAPGPTIGHDRWLECRTGCCAVVRPRDRDTEAGRWQWRIVWTDQAVDLGSVAVAVESLLVDPAAADVDAQPGEDWLEAAMGPR